MRSLCMVMILAVIAVAAAPAGAATVTLYSNDFDGNVALYTGVAGGLSGITTTESVQGFAGLGSSGDTFSGNLLRNSTNPPVATTLTLSNLPTHNSVSINFLFAFIDSWDSTNGSIAPDYFNVTVDGNNILRITANNASGTVLYNGTQISGNANYGWSSWIDRAFDMSSEPALTFAHTANTLTVSFFASGSGWQGGTDESWAIENLKVTANTPVPVPPSLLLLFPGLFGLAAARKRFLK